MRKPGTAVCCCPFPPSSLESAWLSAGPTWWQPGMGEGRDPADGTRKLHFDMNVLSSSQQLAAAALKHISRGCSQDFCCSYVPFKPGLFLCSWYIMSTASSVPGIQLQPEGKVLLQLFGFASLTNIELLQEGEDLASMDTTHTRASLWWQVMVHGQWALQ